MWGDSAMTKSRFAVFAFLAVCALSADALAGPDEPCRVGVQLHLSSGPSSEKAYLRHCRAFVEEGMRARYTTLVASGLKPAERDEVLAYLAEHDVHFLAQETFPYDESERRSESERVRRYAPADYARMRAIAGDCFLGIQWGELDSTGLPPEMYLPEHLLKHATRRQIKDAFVERVRRAVEPFHEQQVPVGHSSAVLWHSLFAEAGVDVLCSEIGENIPNVNMMIASNRGAARAYDRPWMIDHSTWWSPRGHAGSQVSPREGHTPWCLFTTLLGAVMGGVDYVQLEVDWAAYTRDYRPLPWGLAMNNLAALSRIIGPRGNTATPFAILMGHESGWPGVGWRVGDVRGAGLFDGMRHQFMQTRDADLSLKVLDIFYPGFERCAWDPEYPGFLAESPLGTLDIVPDNLSPEKYARYGVLVALGYHRTTAPSLDALRQYVEAGGILVCSDTLFLDESERLVKPCHAEPLIGCEYDRRERKLIHLYQPEGILDEIEGLAKAGSRVEWQDHWLHPVRLTTGRVVGRLDDAPYLIENRLGKGRVFFVTALNMVGSSAERRGQEPFLYANILYHFLHTLEDHVGDGVSFSPWTSLEHIFNEKPDGSAMLLVMNHGDMHYRRDAEMRNGHGFTSGRVLAQGDWQAFHEGDSIEFTDTGDTLAWSFDLPPKSFALFEFRK